MISNILLVLNIGTRKEIQKILEKFVLDYKNYRKFLYYEFKENQKLKEELEFYKKQYEHTMGED